MVEAVAHARRGLYSLRLTARGDLWRRQAARRTLGSGACSVRTEPSSSARRASRAVAEARFLLALDDDTSEFHRRFARDPLLGPSVRTLRGLRPTRTATVAHAALRAVCGQLVQASRARRDRARRHPGLRRGPADAGGARGGSRRRSSPAAGSPRSRAATLTRLDATDRPRAPQALAGDGARPARPRARDRPVERRRHRAPGPRPLRRRARRATSAS